MVADLSLSLGGGTLINISGGFIAGFKKGAREGKE
jgi:hypothetical protein